jgi:predicted nucleotidyltransferase
MNMKKFNIPEKRKREIVSIIAGALSNHREIMFAYLHGSFLQPGYCGDMDIAVYLDSDSNKINTPWEYEARLAIKLDRLAGMPVDIHILNNASPAMRYHASSGELLFSRSELARYTFLEKTWREYFDYRHHHRNFLSDLLDGIKAD